MVQSGKNNKSWFQLILVSIRRCQDLPRNEIKKGVKDGGEVAFGGSKVHPPCLISHTKHKLKNKSHLIDLGVILLRCTPKNQCIGKLQKV